MSLLLSLPAELLEIISLNLAVDDLFNFALTSSRTFQHVKTRLERNQQYYLQYRVQHDRLPLTVPALLRLALSPLDARWLIRTIDLWESRIGFEAWKNWSFFNSTNEGCWGPLEDHSKLTKDYYSAVEYDDFCRVMSDDLNLNDKDVQTWIDRIAQGWDEPLKGMLFALLPGLKRLNFLMFSIHEFGHETRHPLTFLSITIESVMNGVRSGSLLAWPPGYQSLRGISIGTLSSYEHPYEVWHAPASLVSSLFKLPNLKFLDVAFIGSGEESEDSWDLSPQTSSVEELSFDCCQLTGIRSWERFIRAPRKLRLFHTEHFNHQLDGQVFVSLERYHGKSLEYLWLDTPYQAGRAPIAQSFPNLKLLSSLRVTDLLRKDSNSNDMVFRPECSTLVDTLESRPNPDNTRRFQIAELRQMFPTSLETLKLIAGTLRYQDKQRASLALAIRAELLRAVADLVEDERFIHLREVCLYDIVSSYSGFSLEAKSWTDNVKHGWDWDAFHRIERTGIELHLHDKNGEVLTDTQHSRLHRLLGHNRGIIESAPFSEDDSDEAQI